ncbi:hypothetical protein A2U01_0083433, partial [Trifolium medium]|nr:hypothetical protein [Trifolium medium]
MRAGHMIGEWRVVNTVHQQNYATSSATTQTRGSVTAASNSWVFNRATKVHNWQRPRDGWWKCNVD